MNFCKIKRNDIANGPGIRVSLFVSGCPFCCPGCFNEEAWDYNAGEKYTKFTEDHIIFGHTDKYTSGLSVLGGEPLDPHNKDTVLSLCKRYKQVHPDKTVWIWTGYDWDVVKYWVEDNDVRKYVQAIVTGRFIKELYEPNLLWRGSSNQEIHYL